MAFNVNDLLGILNTTNTQKNDQKLYDFLRRLLDVTQQINVSSSATAAVISGGGSGGSGITQLTGDVAAGPGSGSQVATLSNTGVVAGSYTNTDLTVDAKGRITAAADGSSSSGADYVVASNGVQPPTPLDDGVGNFVYVLYTP